MRLFYEASQFDGFGGFSTTRRFCTLLLSHFSRTGVTHLLPFADTVEISHDLENRVLISSLTLTRNRSKQEPCIKALTFLLFPVIRSSDHTMPPVAAKLSHWLSGV